MELQDIKSQETVEFIDKLNKLSDLIKNAFEKRTPHLKGEKYLTTKGMSRILHISSRALNNYRKEGKIPYVKIFGKILYKESEILKILNENNSR